MAPQWIEWSRRLQAIAQTGLTFAADTYDIERYEAVREIAAEIAAAGSGADLAMVRDLFAHDAGYTTPKVDVRAACFRDGKVLLVRERSDGLWTLPGGWADPGDSPAAAAEREVLEETGYSARATKLLAVYDRDRQGHPPIPFSVYKLFSLGEAPGGAPAPSHEILEIGFFAEDEIPPLSLTRVMPGQIERVFAHARNPHWPTDFE
nr:MAG: ADP-ribose pyrophosphatase [Chloroflexota bacterium]